MHPNKNPIGCHHGVQNLKGSCWQLTPLTNHMHAVIHHNIRLYKKGPEKKFASPLFPDFHESGHSLSSLDQKKIKHPIYFTIAPQQHEDPAHRPTCVPTP